MVLSSAAVLRTRLRPVFERFDVDRSGSISTNEMAAVCETIGMQMTPEQLSAMMVAADPDGAWGTMSNAWGSACPNVSMVPWPQLTDC